MRYAYKILVGEPEGEDHSEDQAIDGKIMLQYILENQDGKVWLDSSGSG
jgi:hypothetical protein